MRSGRGRRRGRATKWTKPRPSRPLKHDDEGPNDHDSAFAHSCPRTQMTEGWGYGCLYKKAEGRRRVARISRWASLARPVHWAAELLLQGRTSRQAAQYVGRSALPFAAVKYAIAASVALSSSGDGRPARLLADLSQVLAILDRPAEARISCLSMLEFLRNRTTLDDGFKKAPSPPGTFDQKGKL